MTSRPRKTDRTILYVRIAVAGILVLATVLGILIWSQMLQAAHVRNALVRAYDAQATTLQLTAALSSAETSQRGYVLSGDHEFRDDFEQRRRAVPEYINRLIATVFDDPQMYTAASSLAEVARDRLDELMVVVAIYDKQGPVAARQRITEGRGMRRMAQVVHISSEMLARQASTIDTLTLRQREYTGRVRTVVFALTLGIVLLLLGAVWLVTRNMRQREAALAGIRSGELENTIMAQIAELANQAGSMQSALASTLAAVRQAVPQIQPMAWARQERGGRASWTPLLAGTPGDAWSGYAPEALMHDTTGHGAGDAARAVASIERDGAPVALIGLWAPRDIIAAPALERLTHYACKQLGLLAAREHAETLLRLSAARQRALFEGAQDAVIIVSGNGAITAINRAAQAMFGLTLSEDLHFESLLAPQMHDGEELVAHLRRLTGAPGSVLEVQAIRRNGEVFPAELALSEIRQVGAPIYMASFRDITDRKRADLAKREFVATVSHELRTPLTSIAGGLKLFSHTFGHAQPPAAMRLIDIATRNTQRLANLVNDILDVEKLEAGKMEFNEVSTTLETIVADVIEAISPAARDHNVKIISTGGTHDTALRTDPLRLSQALTNLLSNAIRYSPPGGTVEVRMTRGERSATIHIIDQGPGIPESFIPNMFTKFSQAPASAGAVKGGTGLGLSIVKQIVERLGGRVYFETSPQGTTFSIDLPLPDESAAA